MSFLTLGTRQPAANVDNALATGDTEQGDDLLDRLCQCHLGDERFPLRSGSEAVLFDTLFGAGLPDPRESRCSNPAVSAA